VRARVGTRCFRGGGEGPAEVEVCRQSRLRGRIHARPSASGLAVLCPASSYFISYVSLPLHPCRAPLPSRSPLRRAVGWIGPDRAPSGGPLRLARSPPTRSSRTCPPRATLFTIRSVSRASASIERASSPEVPGSRTRCLLSRFAGLIRHKCDADRAARLMTSN